MLWTKVSLIRTLEPHFYGPNDQMLFDAKISQLYFFSKIDLIYLLETGSFDMISFSTIYPISLCKGPANVVN
jgi:hypothetical protein